MGAAAAQPWTPRPGLSADLPQSAMAGPGNTARYDATEVGVGFWRPPSRRFVARWLISQVSQRFGLCIMPPRHLCSRSIARNLPRVNSISRRASGWRRSHALGTNGTKRCGHCGPNTARSGSSAAPLGRGLRAAISVAVRRQDDHLNRRSPLGLIAEAAWNGAPRACEVLGAAAEDAPAWSQRRLPGLLSIVQAGNEDA